MTLEMRNGLTKSEAEFLREVKESSMPKGYFVKNDGTFVVVGKVNDLGVVAILAVIRDVVEGR